MKSFLDKNLICTSALGKLDSISRNEFWASLALKHTKGLGMRSCKKLLTYFGSAYIAVQNVGQWGEAKVSKDKALEFRLEKWRKQAKQEWDSIRGCPGVILFWHSDSYPSALKELPDPPTFLYCLGDTSLLANPCVAIVGTRKCSINGIQKTREIAKDLAQAGITVVSGLAVGIDREAHLASVDFPGSTIAVLGSGVNIKYPRQNLDIREKIVSKGLIISEYAPNTEPEPSFFPVRNRIISGLSLGVLVIEAELQSGSLITARLALEQNRAVYAFSDSTNSPFTQGCQDILAQGARSISSLDDILDDLFIPLKGSLTSVCSRPKRKKNVLAYKDIPQDKNSNGKNTIDELNTTDKKYSKNLVCDSTVQNDLEKRILEALKSDPKDVEALCQQINVTSDELASTLIMLEVRGEVKRLPNTQYMCVCA